MTEQGKAPAARSLDHAQEIIASLYANGAAMAETIDGLRAQKKALADALERARECHDDHCDRAACAIGPDIRHALILAGRLPSAEEGGKPQRPPAPSTTSSVAPAVPNTGRSSELINAEARIEELTERLRKGDEELVALRMALHEAIVFAEEGWSYAPSYFRDKWSFKERAAALGAVLATGASKA